MCLAAWKDTTKNSDMTQEQKFLIWALLGTVIACAVCGIAGFVLGKERRPKTEPTVEVRIDTVTITEVRIDTIERVRTITAYLPIAEPDDEPMDTIDYPYDNPCADSVAVQIPISRYVAEQDSLYRVVAEGYAVDFKEITVYPKTVTITNTIETRKPTHWGIGIQAGYGATLDNKVVRLSPYVGIGLSYNIISF